MKLGNDEVQLDYPEERDNDEVVRNGKTCISKDPRGCPVEEITDWTDADDTNNGL